MARKRKATKINITESNEQSVEVRQIKTQYAGDITEELTKVEDKDFVQIVRISKKYRRANKYLSKLVKDFNMELYSDDYNTEIINELIHFEDGIFARTIRNAKRTRKALSNLEHALLERKGIDADDREIKKMELNYVNL